MAFKEKLKKVLEGVFLSASCGAALCTLYLGIINPNYKGKTIFEGNIDGKKVVFVQNAGIGCYDHDYLKIYNKDGSEVIFRDGGTYAYPKYPRLRSFDRDGKVDEVSLFRKGREKRIEENKVIDFDGQRYYSNDYYDTSRLDERVRKEAAKVALAEGRKTLEKATQEYQKIVRKIEEVLIARAKAKAEKDFYLLNSIKNKKN